MTNDSPTLDGRPGYFRVYSLHENPPPVPDDPVSVARSGPSAILDARNADEKAGRFIPPSGIFWHFTDEQKDGEEPVRHFVADVPFDRPWPTAQEAMRALHDIVEADKKLRRYQRKHKATDNDLESALGDALQRGEHPKAVGVWAVCEAWLIAKGTAAGKPGKTGKKGRGL